MHFQLKKCIFFYMKCIDIIRNIEDWAPKEIAWQKDNVGLQIGDTEKQVRNILLCLEINDNVVEEALNNNCNLIISHHPFFFSPLKKIDFTNDSNSRLIQKIIKHDIILYSAHTNLDYTKDGVSYQLAQRLELQNIKFLTNLNSSQYKICIFVQEKDCEVVAEAIFRTGGGIVGEYTKCSFRTRGNGTFKSSGSSHPVIGKKNEYKFINEVKLEVLVDRWKLNSVISEIKKVHPYEEISYDIIPLENSNVNYGIGAVGNLSRDYNLKDFLILLSHKLNIKNFRYSKGKSGKIRNVAVCGGSGSEYYKDAIAKNCEAFITADIKYHTFQDAKEKILLVDAGHYETEIFSLNEIKKRLIQQIRPYKKTKVYLYSGSTNPVIFYNY
jgi:dinuclear metal center YbgI/SA1388 family protein